MNKRNHPYFAQVSVPENNELVPVKKELKPVHTYQPRSATPWSPKWINNQAFVENLGSFNPTDGYISKNDGYHIDGMGYLYNGIGPTDEARGGVIAALAVTSDKETNDAITAKTLLMNTEDYGMRHVFYTDTGMVKDYGPVETTCIIGNIDRPEGIYIPMCNTRAMADGILIAKNFLEAAVENDADLPEEERVACPYYIPKAEDDI